MTMDTDGTEDAGWDVDPDDEQGVAVLSALGRRLRVWREEAGKRAADFGVENSKDTALPHLAFSPGAWAEFVARS
ncbi:DUF397 domain-containing protein [Streptomyces sp. NPDC001568]|uniref:DUF397 domain-containing protein n=1 Tax=Streptomyces sp. NPDC001568 TaxID=3364588 RepID=UPI003692A3E4